MICVVLCLSGIICINLTFSFQLFCVNSLVFYLHCCREQHHENMWLSLMLKGTFYIYMNCELWRQSHKCWMTDTWFCVSFVTHILISQNDCFIVITMSVCEMLAVSTSIQRAAVFYSFYLSHLLLRYDNRQWILRNSDIYHLFVPY